MIMKDYANKKELFDEIKKRLKVNYTLPDYISYSVIGCLAAVLILLLM